MVNNSLVKKIESNSDKVGFKELMKVSHKQFKAALQERTPQFMVSLMNFYDMTEIKGNPLEPNSVIQAALTAASLNLVVDKNFGQAWIIPYTFNKNQLNKAQFQMGYRGYIQLAIRTGQYKTINVVPIYDENFISWNPLTEELQTDFTVEADTSISNPVGYVATFHLLNGFTKTIYKNRDVIEAHAKQYSSGYKAFLNKKASSSIWNDNFDSMACKTVLTELLKKWGILSVEMVNAMNSDNKVIKNVDKGIPEVEKEAEKVNEEVEKHDSVTVEIVEDDEMSKLFGNR